MLLRTGVTIVGHYRCLLLVTALFGLPANTGSSSVVEECPKNWAKLEGSCYGYFKERLTFQEAEKKCSLFSGSHLASLHSKKEACAVARYIYTFQDTSDVWVGLMDPKKDRKWSWTDGSSFNYSSWDTPVQPDNFQNNEYCVQLLRSRAYLKWNDINCATKSPYLCKFTPKIKPPPPLPPFPNECS